MHLGFIGLGNLGQAVAGRLLDCGHSLVVWNRTPAKAEKMPVEVAASPISAASNAKIIFLCLYDSNAVHSVFSRQDGLLSGDISGKIIVDLSTNHFQKAVLFHELCRQADASYLEVPVLGSVVPASQGTLTLLIGGNKTAYEKAKPVLEDIGKHHFYFDEPALATKIKLLNNLTLAGFMTAIAEVLSMGEAIGIEKEKFLDILSAGAGNSIVLSAKKNKLLQQDFSTHFSSALLYKDLHCVQDLAYEQKKTLFTGSVVKELYARTFEEGIEQEDFAAIYKLFKSNITKTS